MSDLVHPAAPATEIGTHAVSLEVAVKALSAAVATLLGASLGPVAAVPSAIVGTFVPDAVRWAVRRLGLRVPPLLFLTGLLALFERFDHAVARAARKVVGEGVARVISGAASASSQAAHVVATSAAAATVAVGGGIAIPEAAGTTSPLVHGQPVFATQPSGPPRPVVYTVRPSEAGAVQQVEITTPGQRALVRFEGIGRRVFVHAAEGTLNDYDLVLSDETGTSVASAYVYTGDGNLETDTSLSPEHTYTLELNPRDDATGQTALTLYEIPPDLELPVTPSAAGVVQQLEIGTPGQLALVRFQGTGQRLFIHAAEGTLSDYDLVLRDETGGSVATSYVYTGEGDLETDSNLSPDHSYTLEVNPRGQSTGEARLTLYEIPPDLELPVTPSAAGLVQQVEIGTPGQRAQVRFQGTGQRLFIHAAEGTLSDYDLVLRDETGGSVANSYVYTGEGDLETDGNLSPDHTYTLELDPRGDGTGGTALTLQTR